ncbi:MAG TPA: TonB-dependent receptor [Verrucomicrobiae bacterium]|nr:TonB-dependent receptor [Verrucomicrobiae bacterium]
MGCFLASVAGLALLGGLAFAAETVPEADPPTSPKRDLSELSLEELANIPVTSVSKKPEKLSHAAAAVTVITQEDLRRSGVTTIAEALRLAPGLDVARVDSHTWAVSSRGFNDTFANKLQVLMDGRSVYTPLFSGVYWDVQDTLLEDIDRIEVVRGPGATLWGANAVNGVINIITRSAKETPGGLIIGGGGTEELGFGALRYGGQLAENAYYRVYTKYFSRDSSALPNGDSANDRWQMARTGFRTDWDVTAGNSLTFQGDIYGGDEDQTYFFPSLTAPGFSTTLASEVELSGGNLIGRWRHEFAAGSDSTLQVYYDRTHRNAKGFIEEERDTYDADWEHHQSWGDRQDWVIGAGYRLSVDEIHNSFPVSFDPRRRSTQLFSCFAQDNIALVSDRLQLSLGSKFEHNDYTGVEFQPGARLWWAADEHNSLWASVARAVRTPSRADDDIRLNDRVAPGAPPTLFSVFGRNDFQSEELLAYEAGYRVQPDPRVSFDLAVFYNDYDRLRTVEPQGIAADPSLPGTPNVLSLYLQNRAEGETYGGELTAHWQMTEWWRWRGTYTYLQMQLHAKPGSTDPNAEDDEHRSPHHQFTIQSSMDLPWHLQLDTLLRYVDEVTDVSVPSYLSLDVRLGWQPLKNLEFSVTGQNLLDDRHPEFGPTVVPIQRTEVQRGIYGKILFRF